MNEKTKTVVVGMSGGVDSSVAALLLKEQGYNVIGMFMKNWEECNDDGVCSANKDFEDVVQVCEQIDIPYYSVNFSKQYWDRVFQCCLAEYTAGHTPNPDTLCNREIKFDVFFKKALSMGAEYFATGHYCRTENNCLLRGVDPDKDQSYFLYTIKGSVLKNVLFPIGNLTKKEVRDIAHKHNLVIADKKDSVGICFIGKRNFKQFLSNYIAPVPGNFEDTDGKVVGQHDGIAYYTIGQRKGLGIGGPGEAWFVVDKEPARNVIRVVQGEDHPDLYKKQLIATETSWVNEPVSSLPFKCTAKIRYRQPDTPCTITSIEGDKIAVTFDQPQKAITPRQAIVFYKDDLCLGGAVINNAS